MYPPCSFWTKIRTILRIGVTMMRDHPRRRPPLGHQKIRPRSLGGVQRIVNTSFPSPLPKLSAHHELGEDSILRDVIFALQGIEGEYIKFDGKLGHFVIDPKV